MIEIVAIIIEECLLYAPIIIGAYLTLSLMKIPNMSLEAAFVSGGMMSAKMTAYCGGVTSLSAGILVILSGIIGGLVAGIITGSLVIFGRLPFLLATIITLGLFHGISQYVLGGGMFSIGNYDTLFTTSSLNVPYVSSLITLIILFTLLYFFLKTQLGYSYAIYGNNQLFFVHYGISTNYIFLSGLSLGNALAGLSGALISQKTGFVDITMGSNMLLFCLTALVLGKVIVSRYTSYSVYIPLIGLFLYCIMEHSLLHAGFDLKYFTMVQSLLVAIILIQHFMNSADSTASDHLGI